MGVLVDIVPNHVGVATPARQRLVVGRAEHGQESPYAAAFDIDWDAGGGRLRIPVVGDDDRDRSDGRSTTCGCVDGRAALPRPPLPARARHRRDGDDADVGARRQHYELVHWRVADDDLNYRRFFAVNTLAGVRVEDPECVRRDSHVEIRRWFDEGLVDGLRVDHPDGLRDPARLPRRPGRADRRRLRARREDPRARRGARRDRGRPPAPPATTRSALIDRVLTDPAGEAPLDALEARLRGAPVDWHELIHDTKRDGRRRHPRPRCAGSPAS